ncbi:lysylphosphatidylglycerol synthase domain-containing protein [Cohnella sp. AR92]|uniref:lysylphosphatidylglycerol synthase domain-containing protein n=1 Tax=Cohnella sp. AR92 TaxID=648716 RepID=UPI000F8D4AE7|nr:lysylphosphatidylglycerol synthase domain-containing protein [Cohnella sp. AR92]RUS47363.1 hypothetical protein ELR57_09575 [Cohnella sp. AR92]
MAAWRRYAPAALKSALAAVILYFLARNIPIEPSEIASFLFHANARFYASLLLFSLFLMLQAGIWVLILRAVMPSSPDSERSPKLRMRAGLRVFIDSQFAKYIPGGIWNYAGRIVLAKREGVPFEALIASVVYENVLLVAAALVYSLLLVAMLGLVPAVPLALGALALLALAYFFYPRLASDIWRAFAFVSRWKVLRNLLKPFKRSASDNESGPREPLTVMPRHRFFGCLLCFLTSHFIMGTAFWLMTNSFGQGEIPILYAAGTFAASWLIGLLSPLPGGLGVREGFLVYFLSQKLDSGAALHISVIARLWNVLAEVLFWLLVHAYNYLPRRVKRDEA